MSIQSEASASTNSQETAVAFVLVVSMIAFLVISGVSYTVEKIEEWWFQLLWPTLIITLPSIPSFASPKPRPADPPVYRRKDTATFAMLGEQPARSFKKLTIKEIEHLARSTVPMIYNEERR